MNRYMHALTEVRGRRVRTTRPSRGGPRQPHQEKGTEPAKPVRKGPGGSFGTVTHYPHRTQAEVDADRKRKEAAKRERATKQAGS